MKPTPSTDINQNGHLLLIQQVLNGMPSLSMLIREIASFWVTNNQYIEPEIQQHIFQRSYSTKGIDRGLGTYSMKMLGEHYLHGHVYFHTSKDFGTTFYLELPMTGNIST